MPRFDQFQQASFNSTVFPVDEIEVRGGMREHVHEYSHSPGGTPELEGRKLYEIDLVCPFHDTFRKYPKLYPDGLAAFRGTFESGTRATLVVPTIGSIQAYCYSWTQRAAGRTRSGERVTWRFREDQPADDLDAFLLKTSASGAALSAKADAFKAEITAAPTSSLFDDLLNAVNFAVSFKDTADRYGNLLEAKLLAVSSACSLLDTNPLLRNPVYFRIAYAMQEIWRTANDALKDIMGKKRQFQRFVTTATMSISDVARRLYGDASRGMELLQLNPIEDAFAIPANVSIRYYPAS